MAPELVSYVHFMLLEETGKWDSRRELVDVYLEERDYVYTDGYWGKKTRDAYRRHLQGTEVVLRNITRGGPHGGAWYNGGNLSLVIKELTGKEPDYFISDLRNPGEEKVVRAEDAMRQDIRATLFNRKWIEGMMNEGYAGAQRLAGRVFCTLGWKINRENSVSDEVWQEIVEVYLHDKKNLKIREWFDDKNPYAFQGLTETLLETIRKEYWRPDEATILEIATAYAQSVVQYGHREPGEVNEKLELFLARTLLAPGPISQAGQTAKALLEQYRQKTASEMALPKLAVLPVQYQPKAKAAPELAKEQRSEPKAKESAIPGTTKEAKQAPEKKEKTEQVQGKEIEKVEAQPPEEQKPKETEQVRGKEMEKVEAQPQVRSSISWWVIGIAIAVPLLLIIGYRWRRFPRSKSRS
jgi:cobaltochelatase CobN